MELVEQTIKEKIYTIRGQQVMLDRDLAELYEVKAIALRQQVKRNIESFPEDFMFSLSKDEIDILVSQNVIPSMKTLGGSTPMVFTEQGVAMLASVLKSKKARYVNIQIMRTFVRMRYYLNENRDVLQKVFELEKKIEQTEVKQTQKNQEIFAALKYLLESQDPGTKLV